MGKPRIWAYGPHIVLAGNKVAASRAIEARYEVSAVLSQIFDITDGLKALIAEVLPPADAPETSTSDAPAPSVRPFRNAIVGKVHRLGMSKVDQNRRLNAHLNKAKAKPKPPVEPKPKPPKPQRPLKTATIPKAVAPLATEQVFPEPLRLSLMDLPRRACRRIVSGEGVDALYCARPVTATRFKAPYCDGCQKALGNNDLSARSRTSQMTRPPATFGGIRFGSGKHAHRI